MRSRSTKTAGEKECRNCNKRRIRCDGGVPTCIKCTKKGLTCSGYGPRLRWADGVAVRGRLRGQRLPIVQETKMDGQETSMQRSLATDARSLQHVLSPNLAEDSKFSDYIKYYDKNLAGLMVWIDSAENDYRRVVLPRAVSIPGLRFAIAAFASHHGSNTFTKHATNFHETARDACLALIQTQIKDMNGRMISGSELCTDDDVADAEWMLASILMIAAYEMAKSQSALAEGHRLAARKLVNIFGSRGSTSVSGSLFAFLRNQLAIYDVLASTTSFDLDDIKQTILPTPGSSTTVLFAEYLRFVHKVTLLSRQPYPMPENLDSAAGGLYLSPKDIRFSLNRARGETLIAAGSMKIGNEATCQDMIRLVDIYHYTALVYSYRCLGYANYQNEDWEASKTKLFEQLLELDNFQHWVQNLPWPVFIAGTECHGHVERQLIVRTLLNSIIRATNFKHYDNISSFFEAFWGGQQTDWRPLASDFQRKGVRILVV